MVERRAPGERITILKPCGYPKRRSATRVDGVSSGLNFGVHNNTLVNALRAVRERVFAVERGGKLAPPPRPDSGVFRDRLKAFRAALLSRIGHCTPWTYEEFLASYQGSKLIRYTKAVSSLKVRGLDKRDSYLSSFVKAEAVNFTAKPDPAPRIIQPRGARYNAVVGRFLRPLEHRVYNAIARLFKGPTVMKGYNAVQVAGLLWDMWCEFTHPVALMLDASRFDQHVSTEALLWEHSVYNSVFRDPELRSALLWQLHNKGYVRTSDGAVFSYEVDGCRMSGDMNTALGNCLLMCALVWAYSKEKGVRVRLANNGDDCAVFMENGDLGVFTSGLDKWFLDMGFTLTSEGTAHVFERVDFCQTRPVYTHAGWVMCRNPRLALCKDVLCKFPDMGSPLVSYRRWSYQVGMAGSALADGVPVFSAAYAAMLRHGLPAKKAQGFGNMDTGFEFMSRGMTKRGSSVSSAARVSFWRAWGIMPDFQEALEREYAELLPITSVREVRSAADNPGLPFQVDTYFDEFCNGQEE